VQAECITPKTPLGGEEKRSATGTLTTAERYEDASDWALLDATEGRR
jgi:hypothetical protein